MNQQPGIYDWLMREHDRISGHPLVEGLSEAVAHCLTMAAMAERHGTSSAQPYAAFDNIPVRVVESSSPEVVVRLPKGWLGKVSTPPASPPRLVSGHRYLARGGWWATVGAVRADTGSTEVLHHCGSYPQTEPRVLWHGGDGRWCRHKDTDYDLFPTHDA